MSKTARLYSDTRTANAAGNGLDRLNDDLQNVTRIMTKNMEELLWRGDSLDSTSCCPLIYLVDDATLVDADTAGLLHAGMSHLSSSLRSESEKYRKAARNINWQAALRQYAPIAGIVLFILIFLWWRFF